MSSRDRRICTVLSRVIAEGRRKFILYPFGINGTYVKLFLNKRFGIQECYILDNKLCKLNPNVKDIDFLGTLPAGEYTVLLTHSHASINDEITSSVRRYVSEDCIVDIFGTQYEDLHKVYTKCGKYSAGPLCNHWLVERVGAFSSFAEGCDVVLNHTVEYISTHGFLYASQETIPFLPDSMVGKPGDAWYFPDIKPRYGAHKAGRITIGNDVWLGKNVIITNGANIGDGVIAGAGAVITKDVPDYAIVGGVPAKLIRWRYTKEQVEKLKEIAWWDWPDEKIKIYYEDFYLPIEEFISRHGGH